MQRAPKRGEDRDAGEREQQGAQMRRIDPREPFAEEFAVAPGVQEQSGVAVIQRQHEAGQGEEQVDAEVAARHRPGVVGEHPQRGEAAQAGKGIQGADRRRGNGLSRWHLPPP
jgi:hypothetical protein